MKIKQKHLHVLVLAIVVIVFAIASPRIVNSLKYADSDFFSIWLAARLVGEDQSPYDSNVWLQEHETYGAKWISDSTYLYPIPLAVILAPIGFLSLFDAYTLWVFLSLLMILGSLILLGSIRLDHPPRLNMIIPLVAGALLFRPVLVTARNGQLGGLMLLLISCALYFLEREKLVIAGALIGGTLLKPNLGIPIIVSLALWVLLTRRWRIVIGFGLALIAIFVIGWLVVPGWVRDYLPIVTGKGGYTLGYAPSAWGLAGLACGDQRTCTLGFGLGLSVILFIIVLVFYAKRGVTLAPRYAISVALPAALFVTPYIWAYDLILLLVPIVILSTELRLHGYPYIATATLPLTFSFFALLLIYVASLVGRDAWSASLSLVLFIGILWISNRPSPLP